MSTFDIAVELVLKNEGGYVNDPADPGGETNFGISKRRYPSVDIKNLTRAQAIALYKRDWWDRYGLDRVPDAIAPKLLDAMVNIGASAAVKCLQRALRALGWEVKDDGEIGSETLSALHKIEGCGLAAFYAAFKSELAGYYRLLVAWKPEKVRFINGWLSRAYA